MLNENENIIELCKHEIEQLLHLANMINVSSSETPELFCKQSKLLSGLIPYRIRDIILKFSKYGSESGFLLIKNVPIDTYILPDTPPGNNYKIGEKTTMAKIQSILLHYFSEVIAYEAESYGRIFQDVVPTQSMASVQTSLGSNTELEIHTEQAFSKLRPDILSLACIRGDLSAYTYILPVQRIIDNIDSEEIDLLYEPLWKTGVDRSFKLNGHEFIEGDIRGPMSILNGNKDDPQLIFDQDLMTGISEESDKLVHKLVDIYYKNRIQHNLKPGEIILIDNNRAVHGRSPFFPNFDGQDRFLIRCFSTLDYEKSSYARLNSGRVVSAIYS